jgi:hypothetical protein
MCRTDSARRKTFAAFLAVVSLAGCGTKVSDLASSLKDTATGVADKAGKAARDAAQTAQNVTGKASEALELAGSMELTVDAPLKFSACYVKFITSKTGRPSVLQLQSYREPSQESFPSALVRAQVSASDLPGLKGQTIPAQLFVQAQKDGPVWSTNKDLVQLKITAVDAKTMSAELVSGSLLNASTGASQAVKGAFQGVLP